MFWTDFWEPSEDCRADFEEFLADSPGLTRRPLENHPLDKLTSFRVGGSARWYLEPADTNNVLALLEFPRLSELRPVWIGGGSNLLISSREYPGLVLKLGPEFDFRENLGEGRFRIGAAAPSTRTGKQLSRQGFSGLEFLSTIPGSMGGAVIQNAGCYGGELLDFLDNVTTLENGRVRRRPVDEIQHGYRYTEFMDSGALVLEMETISLAATDPVPGNPAYHQILEKLEDFRERRTNSQPKNRKSAGSVFKNPPGKKAWQLIASCGLRGRQIGQAKISDEHTNFIVNLGKATSSDVYLLIREMEEAVDRKFGLRLEREVQLIGYFPEET